MKKNNKLNKIIVEEVQNINKKIGLNLLSNAYLDEKINLVELGANAEEKHEQTTLNNDGDFNKSVVKQIVWRAGQITLYPPNGGIWFGETKEDVENFALSIRNEKRIGKSYYINIQNPKHYHSFWDDYLEYIPNNNDRSILMYQLMNEGYDGIIIADDMWNKHTNDKYNIYSKQFIVFSEEQIKSI